MRFSRNHIFLNIQIGERDISETVAIGLKFYRRLLYTKYVHKRLLKNLCF